jgi:hypothetical protein
MAEQNGRIDSKHSADIYRTNRPIAPSRMSNSRHQILMVCGTDDDSDWPIADVPREWMKGSEECGRGTKVVQTFSSKIRTPERRELGRMWKCVSKSSSKLGTVQGLVKQGPGSPHWLPGRKWHGLKGLVGPEERRRVFPNYHVI